MSSSFYFEFGLTKICQGIDIKDVHHQVDLLDDVHHQVDLLDGFEFSSLGKLSVSLYVQTFNDG